MNVYNPDDSATKALHKACEQLDVKAVKQALLNGADPNWFDDAGDTPLVACVNTAQGCMHTKLIPTSILKAKLPKHCMRRQPQKNRRFLVPPVFVVKNSF